MEDTDNAINNIVSIISKIGDTATACKYILNAHKLTRDESSFLSFLYGITPGNQTAKKEHFTSINYSDEYAVISESIRNHCESYKIDLPQDINQLTRELYEAAQGSVEVLRYALGSEFMKVAKSTADVKQIVTIYSKNYDIPNTADLTILMQLGSLSLNDINRETVKKLEPLNIAQLDGDAVGENTRFSAYRSILTHGTLDELVACAKKLDKGLTSEFETFMFFCLEIAPLLKDQNILLLADRFKKEKFGISTDSLKIFSMPFKYAKNIDDAFTIAKTIRTFTAKFLKEDTAARQMAILFPQIDNAYLSSDLATYSEFIYQIKRNCEKNTLSGTEENIAKMLNPIADVWLKNPSLVSNTRSNRLRLEGIDPFFLEEFDKKRAAAGLSSSIDPEPLKEKGPQAVPTKLEMGTVENPSIITKIQDRGAGYLVDRAAALADNISGIELKDLHRREEKKGEMTYVHYYESHGTEFIQEIHLPTDKAAFNVYYANESGLYAAETATDTPMQKIDGALFEATGCMVHKRGVPTEVLIVNGDTKQPKIHPTHDGILIIGADGIPHIEHIESIDGQLLGTAQKVDAKYADRDLFTQKTADLKLTAMQAPLFLKDGKQLSVSTVGVPWLKRSFVKFKNGDYGFIESKQPVDQRTFVKVLVDAGAVDAIALDTGYYDRYVDANGERNIGRDFNPVMIYAKKR